MFRSFRYEETPIQLDISLISSGMVQDKIKVDFNLLLMIEVHILIGLMDFLRLNFMSIN